MRTRLKKVHMKMVSDNKGSNIFIKIEEFPKYFKRSLLSPPELMYTFCKCMDRIK